MAEVGGVRSSDDPVPDLWSGQPTEERRDATCSAEVKSNEGRGDGPQGLQAPYKRSATANHAGSEGVSSPAKELGKPDAGKPLGLTGNLAVTYLGSYNLSYTVTSINPENGTATVNFQAHNVSSISSATHPPVIGYTNWWNQMIGTPLNKLFQSGPLSPTVQNLNWTENIAIPQQSGP